VVAISVPGEGFGRAETRPERERAAIKVEITEVSYMLDNYFAVLGLIRGMASMKGQSDQFLLILGSMWLDDGRFI